MSSMTADLEDIVDDQPSFDIEGIPARMKRVRMHHVLGLLKIVGTGIGQAILGVDPENAKEQVAALLFLAIPRAEQETVDFVRSLVEAVDPDDERRLREKMLDPDTEVALEVIDRLITEQGEDLKRIVGKAVPLFGKVAGLFGPDGDADRTPAPSTSSPGNTDGPTTTS